MNEEKLAAANESQLVVIEIRELVARASENDRILITAMKESIEKIINTSPAHGAIALAWIGAESAAAD